MLSQIQIVGSVRFRWAVLLITSVLSVAAVVAAPADPLRRIAGKVRDAESGEAIGGASVVLEGTYLWATSGRDGRFVIEGIPEGDYVLEVSFLGYAKVSRPLDIRRDADSLDIRMRAMSLEIGDVVVTAQARPQSLNTTLVIGRSALDHLQMSNVSDIAALLPGGKTVNPDLTTARAFSLRGGGSDAGNAAFGTVVEVDGVRMGNNASFGAPGGADTRNIPVSNIESVEVITGVPSAEYGDLNSGIVRIHTRRGHTPWNVSTAVNPRTYQFAFSKGFDLGGNRGALNIDGEWTRATKKLSSPYASYTRRGFSVGYSNTFRKVLKIMASVSGNVGGMNTEDDPDAFTGSWTRERDNVVRADVALVWLLNRPWITNLKFDASLFYNDRRTRDHAYRSEASEQPAAHAASEGYFLADKLPYTYFSDQVVDSRELDYTASLKYELNGRAGRLFSRLKAGVQWKATGNAGEGEYYLDPRLAPHGYRPRPYSSYPYMHNLSAYAEENLTLPVGRTSLELMAGVRMENVFVRGSHYDHLNTFSPRFNVRWRLGRGVAVRGGWGVTEKLPSYWVLYPAQEYRDIQTFGFSYDNNRSSYVYYTQPYTLLHNGNLRWQRNHNAEIGVEAEAGGVRISLVGYHNRTRLPYKYARSYTPFSYNVLQLPDGFSMPADPEVKVDSQTGAVYVRGGREDSWTEMALKVTDRTFVASTSPDNGTDIIRRGAELIVDFPEIVPVRTQVRVDAAFTQTEYVDDQLTYYYNTGWSHTSIANRSYQYVGIYAGADSYNGERTCRLDANVTAITHIPGARLVVSCRLEMALLRRSQRLSEYGGRPYAFTVTADSNVPTGGDIYGGDSYTAIRPVAYMDTDGNIRPFTQAEADDPAFAHLIRKSGNVYTFARDGYDPYFSANLSITKEIGDHVSLSFYANNFTNSRRYVTSYATGVGAIFTPDFYYGLTCRLKF